jgi:hypothetical protein
VTHQDPKTTERPPPEMKIEMAEASNALESFKKSTLSKVWSTKSADSWRCDCPALVELYEQLVRFVYFNRHDPTIVKDAIEWILNETEQADVIVV